MKQITIASDEVVSIIGQRGTGKTTVATAIHHTLVASCPYPEIGLILSTKEDPNDLAMWRKAGYVEVKPNRLRSDSDNRLLVVRCLAQKGLTKWEVAQRVIQWCYDRCNVEILIDEFKQVCPTARTPGEALDQAFGQGRGRNIGIIGCTQEPVNIPRQLISQAQHALLMRCPFVNDEKMLQEMCRQYKGDLPDAHGFWWGDLVGGAAWTYYPDFSKFPLVIR